MISGYRDGKLCPEDAKRFVASQFQRFGIPVPDQIRGIIDYGICCLIDLCDYMDPYFLFSGYCDTQITAEWAESVYEIFEDGECVHRCSTDHLETFKSNPMASENFFNEYIAKPGLESLPDEIKFSVKCFHDEIKSGDRYLYSWDNESEIIELFHNIGHQCRGHNGEINVQMAEAYFDLSLWAAAIWMIGPLSREFRRNLSDIIDLCLEDGECILYDYSVYRMHSYRKVDRIPGTCEKCGLGAWCVEDIVLGFDWVKTLCEFCCSNGERSAPGPTACGTRICRYSVCPYHPFHGKAGGMHSAHRAAGQLNDYSQNRRELALNIKSEPKRLTGSEN